MSPSRRSWYVRPLRFVLVTAGLLAVIGVLAGLKFSQISMLIGMGEAMAKSGPPPESVGSARAEAQTWEGTLSAVGSVTGKKSVAVSADAAGIVSRIRFESGDFVKQGDVLVELDASVERAQLASAKARRDLAQINAARSRKLIVGNAITQQQLDTDEATLEAAVTDVATVQAQVERKLIRAPFSGRLGVRAVNVGQYLSPGTMVAMLDDAGEVFVDFSLPQERLASVKVGMPVRIELAGQTPLDGAVAAIEPTVDDATRSLKLRAAVSNDADRLRPGMFVNVAVVLPERASVVIVPATSVIHASFGDSVFVIEDKPADAPGLSQLPDGRPVKVARQQFVRAGESRGDFVAITDGISAGQEVVSAGAFKLRNGAPVVVDNTVQPKAELDPRPENR